MSEFAVYRTLGNGRCLVLDDTRIAGGKPDYRGNNYITSWVTNETYGPVDELKDENAKLRELCKAWYKFSYELFDEFIGEPEMNDDFMELDDRLRKMGVEPY